MPVQVTIIGLGQTGISLGLALAGHKDKVFVTGHDKEYSAERLAKQKGAADATNHNLPGSVENADLILLAIPVHAVRDTFRYITPDLKKDAVVVDLCPVKAEVAKWAKESLPAHSHYVGLVPVTGAAYLHEAETGRDAARADLFSRSVFLLSAPPGTPGEAIKLVSDLVGLLGATTMIADIAESDGLMVSARLLPQLTSTALLNATIDQPGWQEVRKVAGRAYFSATSAFGEDGDADALSMSSLHNRENVVHGLNRLITALIELRDDIEDGKEDSLKERFESARKRRETWLTQRGKSDWLGVEKASVEKISVMEQLLGSKLGRSRKKNG